MECNLGHEFIQHEMLGNFITNSINLMVLIIDQLGLERNKLYKLNILNPYF